MKIYNKKKQIELSSPTLVHDDVMNYFFDDEFEINSEDNRLCFNDDGDWEEVKDNIHHTIIEPPINPQQEPIERPNIYTSTNVKFDYDNGYNIVNGVKKDMNGKIIEDEHEDKVNHPSHYTWLKDKCGVEVIDITRHMDFDLGNAIKYILRSGHKSEDGYSNRDKEIEDLEKAVFYLNDKINMLKNKR